MFSKIFKTETLGGKEKLGLFFSQRCYLKYSTYFWYKASKWQKVKSVFFNYCSNMTIIQFKSLNIKVFDLKYYLENETNE